MKRGWRKDKIAPYVSSVYVHIKLPYPQLLFIDYDLHHSSIHNIKWEQDIRRGRDSSCLDAMEFTPGSSTRYMLIAKFQAVDGSWELLIEKAHLYFAKITQLACC